MALLAPGRVGFPNASQFQPWREVHLHFHRSLPRTFSVRLPQDVETYCRSFYSTYHHWCNVSFDRLVDSIRAATCFRALCQLAAPLHQPIAPPLPRRQLQGLKMDQIPRHLPFGDSEVGGEGPLCSDSEDRTRASKHISFLWKGRRPL